MDTSPLCLARMPCLIKDYVPNLRLRFLAQAVNDNHDSDGGIYSQTVTLRDICLCAEEDADLINRETFNTLLPQST
jgi:hypothetical protein